MAVAGHVGCAIERVSVEGVCVVRQQVLRLYSYVVGQTCEMLVPELSVHNANVSVSVVYGVVLKVDGIRDASHPCVLHCVGGVERCNSH